MKRVHSFKKLKAVKGSPIQSHFSTDEAATISQDGYSKQPRPRSVSAVSTSSAFAALAITDGMVNSRLAESFRGTGSTSEVLESAESMVVGPNSLDVSLFDTNGVEPPISATHATALGSTSGASTSTNGMPGDVPDGGPPLPNDSQREHLRQKIIKISEQIKIEQSTMDENVSEYLKLSSNADKQQATRIKSVFEKKNQKSKATVANLQKKLDTYHKRYKELESSGTKTQSGGKYGFKEVSAKLTDFSGGVVGTVKQGILNSKLINKRFGSVDNITSSIKDEDTEWEDLERSNSVGSVSAATSDSGEQGTEFQTNRNANSQNSQSNSQQNQPQSPPSHQLTEIKSKIMSLEESLNRVTELEAQQKRLKIEIEQISSQIKRDIGILTTTVEQSSYRCNRIEDQLHDLSEMHHREMSDVKQELASLEDKLTYHAQERARDIQEALESCQTRISKMEVQQQHTHQELVTMEGVENATARALAGKLINLLLSVLAVILVFVSTVSSIVMPFIRSQTRAVITCAAVLMVAIIYRNWEPWTGYLSETWLGR